MTSIASAIHAIGHNAVMLGEGDYDFLFKDMGFKRVYVPSEKILMSPEKFRTMHNLDDGGFNFLDENELMSLVKDEVKILNELKPDAVITGFRPSISISTKICKIPLVWVLSAVVFDPYYKFGLATLPYGVYARMPLLKLMPPFIRNTLAQYVPMNLPVNMGGFNMVMKNHNLKPFKSPLKIIRGDLNIMTDAEELFPEYKEIGAYNVFTGPILMEKKMEMPESMKCYKKNPGRPLIFLSMGSSGDPILFSAIIKSFKNQPFDVFAALTTIIKKEDIVQIPENVFAEKFFPARELTEMSDVAVIHGGQGTVYTTAKAATPFVGVPMFSEQQYNLENLARKGSGIVLSRPFLKPADIISSIKKILYEPSYKKNAVRIGKILEKYDRQEFHPPTTAAKKILEFIDEKQTSYFKANGW